MHINLLLIIETSIIIKFDLIRPFMYTTEYDEEEMFMKFNKRKINTVDINQAKKSVFATGIGNAMEWFDFALYSYLAVIISKNFFSQVDNDEIKLIFTFATFAIAFLLRPVGGIFFGKIGDKYGRKVVLTTTIILMAFSTFLIGILPCLLYTSDAADE